MVQLLVWGLVCVAIALSCQKRPVLVLGIILSLRLMVPSTAGWLLIGNWQGSAAMHPATLLLIVWSAFALLSNPLAVIREWRKHWVVHALLSLAVVVAIVMAVLLSGPTSLFGLTNSLLAGILFFFCLRVTESSGTGAVAKIVRLLIILMTIQSVLVVIQWIVGTNVPWQSIAQLSPGTRPLGTFDSPLDLGLAAALTLPLLASVRRLLSRYVLLIVMLAAVVLSESRTPTIMAAIGAAYLIFSAFRTLRSFVAMGVVVSIGAVIFVNLPILNGLVERFTGDDGNSSAARSVATDFILTNLDSVLVFGNGWGSSYALKGTFLETSLENGYAILAFDLGGIAVILLLLGQILIALSRRGLPGAWLAAIFGIAGGFTYSGITTMSAISIVIWTVLAARLTVPYEQSLVSAAGVDVQDFRNYKPSP